MARVALAAILLVGVPIAEAATCGGEGVSAPTELSAIALDSSAASTAETDGEIHDYTTQGGDQHCIHGHCHHSTPFKTNDAASPIVLEVSIALQPIPTVVALTLVSSGFERPPKA